MTNIVVSTVGTTGDVLPHVALAHGLTARGHHVRACSHAHHRTLFEDAGAEFVAAAPPLEPETFNQALDRIARETEPITQFWALIEHVLLAEPENQLAAQLTASKDADVVVANGFDYVAIEAAIRNGVPWASVLMMPDTIPTDEAPPYPHEHQRLGLTRFLWMTARMDARPHAARVKETLTAMGAAERPLGIAGAVSDRLTLVAASRHLVDLRSDWPAGVHVTGPWHQADLPAESPELNEFLARHPDPIVVTFGSMGGVETDETSAILLDALDRVDRPAIVQRGYAGLDVRARARITSAVPSLKLLG